MKKKIMSKVAKNITEPYDDVFQVRVRRNSVISSKCFSAKDHETREKALEKAIEWRNAIIVQKGEIDRVGKETKPNNSTGIHGVSSRLKKAKGRRTYLIHVAHYKNRAGEHKNKSFTVGNIDKISQHDVTRALKVCILFRKQYEQSKELGIDFIENEFKNWKSWGESEIILRLSSAGVNKEELNSMIASYDNTANRSYHRE